MTRETLADTLEEIALLLELKGENPFKIRAYRTGAETVSQFPGDIVALAGRASSRVSRGSGRHSNRSSTNWPRPGISRFMRN